MNEWIKALILGVVEGLTEFIPVSSTGHLIIAGELLQFTEQSAASFEIFIQLGAILSVVWLYRQRFALMFDFSPQPKTEDKPRFRGQRAWLLLGITSLPAMVLGLVAHKTIKALLFNPITVAWALLVGGVILLFIERLLKPNQVENLDDITPKNALLVGLFQCFALWPGMSRSASTIIGGMTSGMTRQAAAEYSFIAAVPIMVMATAYDLLKSLDTLRPSDGPVFLVGFVVSFISALLAIKAFIGFLNRHPMAWFGAYRILVALLCFWLFAS